MTWFLRLFRAFRELELDLQRQRDESSAWQSRHEAAEARAREMTDKLLEDRAKLADTMSLHAIGKRVYSKADPVPAEHGTAQIVAGREFARHAQQRKTAEFFSNLRKEMTPNRPS